MTDLLTRKADALKTEWDAQTVAVLDEVEVASKRFTLADALRLADDSDSIEQLHGGWTDGERMCARSAMVTVARAKGFM